MSEVHYDATPTDGTYILLWGLLVSTYNAFLPGNWLSWRRRQHSFASEICGIIEMIREIFASGHGLSEREVARVKLTLIQAHDY